ncbi:MAG: GNAT family N-acetyltransferase [Bacteriovoracaceae bacterium]|nr:GNAT family N-acetyltransferase [Bacteriovoracaceae bacterium]
MNNPFIRSERTELSLPEIGDVSQILNFYNENKEHLSPWDPAKPSGFYTKGYWQSRIQAAQNDWLEKSCLRLVVKESSSKKIIGFINFTGIERGPFQACRLGYKVHHEFEGQGYMKESLTAAINYTFEKMNIHRIEANYIPDNIRSGHLLNKIGFVKEGEAKNYLKINGRWQDHILTSLTNEKWRDE